MVNIPKVQKGQYLGSLVIPDLSEGSSEVPYNESEAPSNNVDVSNNAKNYKNGGYGEKAVVEEPVKKASPKPKKVKPVKVEPPKEEITYGAPIEEPVVVPTLNNEPQEVVKPIQESTPTPQESIQSSTIGNVNTSPKEVTPSSISVSGGVNINVWGSNTTITMSNQPDIVDSSVNGSSESTSATTIEPTQSKEQDLVVSMESLLSVGSSEELEGVEEDLLHALKILEAKKVILNAENYVSRQKGRR